MPLATRANGPLAQLAERLHDTQKVRSSILLRPTMDKILIYTIYDRPDDYPQEVVCRINYVDASGVMPDPELFSRGLTVEEIRSKLPEGLVCVGRQVNDVPQIVESWM